MNSIKEIETRLGQFSESIPYILVVQKSNGEHITADNFSSNSNQIALTRVLKSIITKYLPHHSISLTALIRATKELVGPEVFDRDKTPSWDETQHAYQRFDVLNNVNTVFHASLLSLQNLITINEISSFLLCISPNDQRVFCQIADRKKDPVNKTNIIALMLLDYARYYNFDPVQLLQNLQLVAQL